MELHAGLMSLRQPGQWWCWFNLEKLYLSLVFSTTVNSKHPATTSLSFSWKPWLLRYLRLQLDAMGNAARFCKHFLRENWWLADWGDPRCCWSESTIGSLGRWWGGPLHVLGKKPWNLQVFSFHDSLTPGCLVSWLNGFNFKKAISTQSATCNLTS